jgi:hypothetical protein
VIGSGLTRYSDEVFLCWDTESCHPSLNLAYARPWELTYALATLKGGIQSIHTHLIRWPNMVLTEDNPSLAHFDPVRYEREARDPREVYGEFGPLLRKHRSVFHGGLGFDVYVEGVWRREIGLRADYEWLRNPGCLDTNCLSKALKGQWTPDTSSPEAFLAWQYRAYHTFLPKGTKTKLGDMCVELGIEFDAKQAHGAEYDVTRTMALLKELVFKIEV